MKNNKMNKLYRLNNLLNSNDIIKVWFDEQKTGGQFDVLEELSYEMNIDKEYKKVEYRFYNWYKGDIISLTRIKFNFNDKINISKKDDKIKFCIYHKNNKMSAYYFTIKN